MKIEQLLTTLAARGVTQAALRAGPQMQLQIGGQWQAQNVTLTDENLSAMIDEALEPASRAAWDSPEGRAGFEMQGFTVAARRSGGAVQILIKQSQNAVATDANAPLQAVANAPVQAPAPLQAPAPIQAPVRTAAPSPDWFMAEGETERGPFAPQKMQMMVSMGTVAPGTLVWRDGMDAWAPLQQTELAGFIPAAQVMAPIASPTGEVYQPRGYGGIAGLGGNDSGSGERAVVPPGIGSWNWGAFFLPVFWGWSHGQSGRAWAILLIPIIPIIGSLISLALIIMMAMEGNALAWKYRRWDSAEHLKKTEQIWMFWGLGLLAINVLVVLIAVLSK